MKKLLVLGASGLVGKAIVRECSQAYDIFGTYFSSQTTLPLEKQFYLDYKENRIADILKEVQPDIIISSLQGEYEAQLIFHKTLANKLRGKNIPIYFMSTTNVFDGDLTRHHDESDMPISKSEYGQYKINCEKMLTDSLGENLNIIRIPGIWGKDSERFNKLKENISTGQPIKVYSNLECNFLSDVHLAKQIRFIFENEVKGIIHLGAINMIKEEDFINQITSQLTTDSVSIEAIPYQESEKTYFFGLISKRKDLPDHSLITNEEIISYLMQ